MRTISMAAVLSMLLACQGLSQVNPKSTGTIRGTVFVSSADGEHSLVAHATIHLEGPDMYSAVNSRNSRKAPKPHPPITVKRRCLDGHSPTHG
jgi:hypothetical protein